MVDNIDRSALVELFDEYDKDGSGKISIDELELILAKFGVAPLKDPLKKSSASKDKPPSNEINT